jgi:lysozyme family protein
MTHEVNAKWMTTPPRSPSDADVAAGLIETADQRQRVGFVNHPKDPGGVTKFGVAQRFNPSERVQEMEYAAARQTGYNVYWLAANNNCQTIAATSPRIAVMVFDMNYLMGAGGSRRTVLAAGVTTTETGAAEIVALEKLTEARLAYLRSRPGWPTFGRGWTKRANECLEYAKA